VRLGLVVEWASAHRHELMEDRDLARRQQPFKRAAPDRDVNQQRPVAVNGLPTASSSAPIDARGTRELLRG
jgi:hypothetical protein